MKPTITLLAGLLFAGVASAGDVYVTRDAQGNPVYTDTPQTLPAQRMGIQSSSTDPAQVQARQDELAKQLAAEDRVRAEAAARSAATAKAQAMSAEDRAQRCAEARERYQAMMQGYRIYEMTPDGERRYLTSEEIDAGRVSARQVMEEFCGTQ